MASNSPSVAPYYGRGPYKDDEPLLMESVQTRPSLPLQHQTVVTVERTHVVPDYDTCHLAWAIISAFLCPVFGVVATVMAMLGYTDHRTGNYNNYSRKRRCAIGFLVMAILLGLTLTGLYLACLSVYSEEIKEFFKSLSEDSSSDLDNSGLTFGDHDTDDYRYVKNAFHHTGDYVKNAFQDTGDYMKNAYRDTGDYVKNMQKHLHKP